MHQRTPVVTCVEELTVVVASREDETGYPPLPPCVEAACTHCQRHVSSQHRDEGLRPPEAPAGGPVFAQAPNESTFLFEERLRQCLDDPALLRALAHAVLVCAPGPSDREFLRRLRLVAARVRPGGSVTLSHNQPPASDFADGLTRLAEFASAALAVHGVKVTALPASKMAEESAPLSAAWQRLQRLRGDSAPTATPATHTTEPPTKTRTVVTQTVLHQRKTQSHRVDWNREPDSVLILPR